MWCGPTAEREASKGREGSEPADRRLFLCSQLAEQVASCCVLAGLATGVA